MAARFKAGRVTPRDISPHTGGWQIVYAGFILIMLSFFILLTSFASLDQSKITRFVSSFSNAVNVMSGGQSIEKGDTLLDAKINLMAKADMAARLFEKVRRVMIRTGLEGVRLQQTRDAVVLTLKEKLLFESGQSRFSPDALARMAQIGQVVRTVDVPVEIQGHTDDRPVHSTRYASNWELSTDRAMTVLRYLIDKEGIDARRLSAVGYAQYRPIANNDTAADRAVNRRVDIVFKVDSQPHADVPEAP
ncbi:MAG: OmpA family protein [Desulfatitalea sp.]|nr:OmpA family protein [Desulfatitalea sp.]